MIARLVLSCGRFKTADSRIGITFVVRFHILCDNSNEIVLKYKDQEIASLTDIQKLTAKDLCIILKSHSEPLGGMKADLVLKVYALLMWEIIPSAATNDKIGSSGQSDEDFKYDSTMRGISPPGWSTV